MNAAWVLGSGGLLGAALCRALQGVGTPVFAPAQRFSWHDSAALGRQLEAAVAAFSARAQGAERWEIYWAAGVGTMSSPAESLAAETAALAALLRWLEADPVLMARNGTVSLASSAGAIYAGSSDELINEHTPPAPTTAYANEKTLQEQMVRSFAARNERVTTLIARLSTLYGAGQNAGKKQGLLGHIARSVVRNQLVQIYVPYDTIRDYIDADDAARVMVTAARATHATGGAVQAAAHGRCFTKIIASESPTTIAEIVSIFRRLARRAPRIVCSANKMSALYARRIQFSSVVFPECAQLPSKQLAVGIGQLMAGERRAFVAGRGPLTHSTAGPGHERG